MAKAKSKQTWFIAVRGSYLPSSPIGLTIYGLYVVYVVALAAGWYADGHRIWYMLVNVIPLSVAAALVTQYIAAKHSK